jgi:hypothetical protein
MIFNYGGGSNGATFFWGGNKFKYTKVKLKVAPGAFKKYGGTAYRFADHTPFCDGIKEVGISTTKSGNIALLEPDTGKVLYHDIGYESSGLEKYSTIHTNLNAKKTALTAYENVTKNIALHLWYINPDFEFSYVVKFPQTSYTSSGSTYKTTMYESVHVCPLDDGKSVGWASDKYTSADFGTSSPTELGKDVVFIVDGTTITDVMTGVGKGYTLNDFIFIDGDVYLSCRDGVWGTGFIYKIDLSSKTATLVKSFTTAVFQSIGRGVLYNKNRDTDADIYQIDENWNGTKIGRFSDGSAYGIYKCNGNGIYLFNDGSAVQLFTYSITDDEDKPICL